MRKKSRWTLTKNDDGSTTASLDTRNDIRYELPYVFDLYYDIKTKAELRHLLKDWERQLVDLPKRINELKCLIAQEKIKL